MSNTAKHKFQSAKSDGVDGTKVRPSNWDDEHVFSGGTDGYLLARDSTQTDGVNWVKPGYRNLIVNDSFETGYGTWECPTTSATYRIDSNQVGGGDSYIGQMSLKITRNGTDAVAQQNVGALYSNVYGDGSPLPVTWKSKAFTLGVYVKCSAANRARVGLSDGVTAVTYSSYHSGSGQWEFLTVTKTLSASASNFYVVLHVDNGNTSANFDGVTLVLGTQLSEWVPSDQLKFLATPQSWLWNGEFRVWAAGASAAPTNWTLVGAGASVARSTTGVKIGPFSAQLTRAGTDCRLKQTVTSLKENNTVDWMPRAITVGAWVRASADGIVRLGISVDGFDYTTPLVTMGSTGSPTIQLWVTKTIILTAAPAVVEPFVSIEGSDGNVYVSGMTLVQTPFLIDYVQSYFTGRKCVLAFGSNASQAQNLTRFYGPWGGTPSTNEVEATMPVPYKGVARNLQALSSVAPAGGQTATATLRQNETTDTTLTAQITSAGRTASDTSHEVALAQGDNVSIKFVTSATSGTLFLHAAVEYEEIP